MWDGDDLETCKRGEASASVNGGGAIGLSGPRMKPREARTMLKA